MREAPGGESGEEQLGPGRREVISEEREQLASLERDHRVTGAGPGLFTGPRVYLMREGGGTWTQYHEQPVSHISFRDQCRNRNVMINC